MLFCFIKSFVTLIITLSHKNTIHLKLWLVDLGQEIFFKILIERATQSNWTINNNNDKKK